MAAVPTRQRLRRSGLIWSLLLFPVTMYYFSPVLSLAGASQNIVTGSALVFGAQFVIAIFLGRAFCGWVCPAGAVQELFADIRPKPLRPRWVRVLKWVIWVPWVAFLVYLFVSADGVRSVDFDAFTSGGISLTDASGYIVYYIVLTVFVVLAVFLGRRAGCHSLCWMAPFMIIGRSLRNWLRIPALHLRSEPSACVHCGSCSARCPMSLPVESLVERRVIDSTDCILCGECSNICPKHVIAYGFSSARPESLISSASPDVGENPTRIVRES